MTTSYVFLPNGGAVGVTEEHYVRLLARDLLDVFPCNVFFVLYTTGNTICINYAEPVAGEVTVE